MRLVSTLALLLLLAMDAPAQRGMGGRGGGGFGGRGGGFSGRGGGFGGRGFAAPRSFGGSHFVGGGFRGPGFRGPGFHSPVFGRPFVGGSFIGRSAFFPHNRFFFSNRFFFPRNRFFFSAGFGSPFLYGGGYYDPWYYGDPYYAAPYYAPPPPPTVIVEPQTAGPEVISDRGYRYESPRTLVERASLYLIATKEGTIYAATDYWLEGNTVNYVARNGDRRKIELDTVDLDLTKSLNRERGIDFRLPYPAVR